MEAESHALSVCSLDTNAVTHTANGLDHARLVAQFFAQAGARAYRASAKWPRRDIPTPYPSANSRVSTLPRARISSCRRSNSFAVRTTGRLPTKHCRRCGKSWIVPTRSTSLRSSCILPENRFDPQHQFARAEGFHHVVVGAEFESDDAVDFFAARRQHDDGNPAGVFTLAQGPADFHAVDVRQHEIENDQIRRLLSERSPEPYGRLDALSTSNPA